jgi:hypothetical protein
LFNNDHTIDAFRKLLEAEANPALAEAVRAMPEASIIRKDVAVVD